MATEYVAGETLFHLLDPRAKFMWFLTIMILSISFLDPLFLLSLFLFGVCVPIKVAKLPRKNILKTFRHLIPILLLFFFLNLFFFKHTKILFWIIPGILGFSLEGVAWALSAILRFFIMIFTVMVLYSTTPIMSLILGLTKLKLPAEYGIALGIGFGYVPELINMTRTIMDAQKARGWRFDYRNPVRKLLAYSSLLIPTLINSIRSGTLIAASIESRGFSHDVRHRTYRKELKFREVDWIFTTAMVVLLLFGVVIGNFGLKWAWTLEYTVTFLKWLFKVA